MTQMNEAALPPLEVLDKEQEIIRVLDQLVREAGEDYVYNTDETANCAYLEYRDGDEREIEVGFWGIRDTGYEFTYVCPVEELKGSCILGQMMLRMGVDKETLAHNNQEGWDSLDIAFKDDISPKFGAALGALQRAQDVGVPWGEAVESFKKAVAT